MKEMRKVILITGAAGFIGSNLAKNILQKDSEVQVIGIDNLNDYYDVSLKEYRLKELENWDHFSFHKGNIADRSFLEQIFQKWEPEIVVNLAAQAGVRYSITNPDAYIESNILGFYNILECCRQGYELGFRTFVLQGGEDGFFTDDRIVQIVRKIKEQYPDCALTLSIGEKSEESYRAYREAGADRYLLRHETADPRHYMRLHPLEMSGENRKNCLRILKKLGYQTGAGFMVGSPLQTVDDLVEDFLFLK